MVQSPIMNLDANAIVDILVNPHTREWNSRLVRETFSLDEVDMILSLPLSPLLSANKQICMVWYFLGLF